MSARQNDLNSNTYVGMSFPLNGDTFNDFALTKTTIEQSVHNLRNLLLTVVGERVGQPEFGSQLKSIVFEQGANIPDRIEEAVRSATDNFLSYINIINVFTIQEQNQVNVQIEFSVPLNPDAIEVLNFDFRIGD